VNLNTSVMRKLFFVIITSLSFIACKKEDLQTNPPVDSHPQMLYKDLQNATVKYLQAKGIDVDNDGSADFAFSVQLVGDPLLQRDRWQFIAHSGVNRNLLNDANDNSPMLNRLDAITKQMSGYTWYEISAIVLAEKIVTNNGNYWDGVWKSADHKFLPIQLKKEGRYFHGWIELSFNTAEEKLVLHRSAISKEEEKTVKAGY
jgi:hypothetical protein